MSQSQYGCGLENRLPVAYASQLLSKAERNYGITDLEGLAVLWAISHLKHIYTRNAFYYYHRPLGFESIEGQISFDWASTQESGKVA